MPAPPFPNRGTFGLAPFLALSVLFHGALALWLGPHWRPPGPDGKQPAPAHRVALQAPAASGPEADEASQEAAAGPEPTTEEAPRSDPPVVGAGPGSPKRTLKAPQTERSRPEAGDPPEEEREPTPEEPAEADDPPQENEKPEDTEEEQAKPEREAPEASPPAEPQGAEKPASEAPTAERAEAGRTSEARPADGVNNPRPTYPRAARRMGMEGRVVLEVTVGAEGRAQEVTVAESSGHGVLDRAARRAVRRWRFEPARAAGQAVASTTTVPVRFELR